jgi:hypothetical protein
VFLGQQGSKMPATSPEVVRSPAEISEGERTTSGVLP